MTGVPYPGQMHARVIIKLPNRTSLSEKNVFHHKNQVDIVTFVVYCSINNGGG